MSWIIRSAPNPRLAGKAWLPPARTLTTVAHYYSALAQHRQHRTLCTVKKQRKALFLPQWIYILRPSISSWHLVHTAISRWITVKALHPFHLSYAKENISIFGDSSENKAGQNILNSNFLNQNERGKKTFCGNLSCFSNHSPWKGAL